MMNDNIKENWQNLGNFTGYASFSRMSPDQFRKSRSGTIYSKIRSTLIIDLVLKTFFAVIIAVDIVFFYHLLPVVVMLVSIFILLVLTYWTELVMLREFSRISDPGQSSRDNLASMLTFLERKSLIPVLCMAATQVIIFVPGLLFYFQIFYGYLKPISPFSFFVFGILCMIGFTTSLLLNLSQVNYHKKHIQACLSDLNEDTMVMVAQNIEESRKKDATIKFLTGIAVVFGFVVILVLLKAVIT